MEPGFNERSNGPSCLTLALFFSDLDAFIRVIEKGAELGALPVNDAAEEEPEQLEVATIQPVRAAEYFQDVVGTLGPWMILVSSKASECHRSFCYPAGTSERKSGELELMSFASFFLQSRSFVKLETPRSLPSSRSES